MNVRTGLLGLVTVAALGATSCDGVKPPLLASVSGLVTYRGVPLPGGLIVFTPDDESGSHGPSAQGVIGPDGRYTLNTEGVPGATPGRHRVTVSGPATPGWILPIHFRDPRLSGLQADVLADRDNMFDWRLEDR